NTSRTCPKCGHISKDNRKTQAVFCCKSCGYTANADENAAKNILREGLSRLAQEVNSKRSQHCEPTEAEQ
ncbi:zinc ribbon domain-containing protein, partial [Succinivibrio dextrinosolvens]